MKYPSEASLTENGISEYLVGFPGKDEKAYLGPPSRAYRVGKLGGRMAASSLHEKAASVTEPKLPKRPLRLCLGSESPKIFTISQWLL